MTSLTGYTNNGLNQSLNGISSLSDGAGTIIQDGNISTNDITIAGDLINNYNKISNLLISYLYGLTGNIQTQINSIDVQSILNLNNTWTGTNIFSNNVNLNGNLILNSTTISPTVLSFLNGLNSNVQNQISSIDTSALLSLANTWTEINTFNNDININTRGIIKGHLEGQNEMDFINIMAQIIMDIHFIKNILIIIIIHYLNLILEMVEK
jgi:hypothetical protein